MSIAARGALAAAAALVFAAPLSAQAGLDRVEELARLGRAEEARTVLLEWWDADRSEASRRDLQRGLWLRGRLTVDPVQAELDFQRLVVLYPSGPYTPQALFRLAQSAYAQGDAEAARSHIATLARDYPSSPSRGEAEAWLRAAGPVPPPVEGTATRSAQDLTSGAASDSAAAGAIRPSPARPPAPADEVLDWMVQFGAFSDEDRAFALHGDLIDAGLAARLVRVAGSAFVHVRIGRFNNRGDANRLLEDVTARGFTAAIVRDGRPEEIVRR